LPYTKIYEARLVIAKAAVENSSISMDRKTITSTARRVIKNTGALLLGNIFSKFCSLAFWVVAARHIGVSQFGKFSFALSFAVSFLVLGDLGLNIVAVREVAADKSLASKYLGNIVILKMIVSAILLGTIFITITLLNYPLDTTRVVYIIGISIFFTFFSTALRWSFHAFQKMEYDALVHIAGGILLLTLCFITLYLRKGLIGFALAHCSTSIFVFCLIFFITVKKFAKPKLGIDWGLWKYLIPAAIPVGLVTILCTLRVNIDTVMLSLLKGDAPVGWYNAGVKLVKVLELIPSMFTLALFPVMVDFYKTSSDSLRMVFSKSIEYMFLLAVPIAVGITVLADKIIFLIWGAEFSQAVPALQILVWRAAIFFLSIVTCWCLYTINKQKIPMYIYTAGIIINISINLILIPKLSYIGVAIAGVITESIIAALLFFFAFRSLRVNPFHFRMLKITIASLLMGTITWIIKDFNVIVVVLISMIFYFTVLSFWKVVVYKELQQLMRV